MSEPQTALHQHSEFSVLHSNLAYIIYTSGTTGKPKGVLVEHRSVVNLIVNQKNYFKIKPSDRILQLSSLCFDASVEQILISFFSGAILVLIDKNTLLEKEEFAAFMVQHKITHIHATPSFLNSIYLPETSSLKCVVVGGDICPVSLAAKYRSRFNFYNEYGPTEATVTSIEIWLKDFDVSGHTLPIGKPVANTAIYLLDRQQKPVPLGVTGEMYIGGAGIARGYLNNPELTAERFKKNVISHLSLTINNTKNSLNFPNDQCPMTNDRYYKTGDLARWLANGTIEFKGRIDYQVKIRGFRIELGEIQNRLSKFPGIKELAVTVQKETSENGDNYICVYFVSDCEIGISALREHLALELPDYMIPAYFVPLEKMPLTSTGKIDRKALPKPDLKPCENYTAPRNELEKKLAKIWKEILDRDKSPGIDDNFFYFGGHSLKAAVLTSRIHKELQVKLPLVEIFNTPTIRGLALYIDGMANVSYHSLMPAEEKEYYSLSSAQKRLYVVQQMNIESTAYNMPEIIPLIGKFDLEKITILFQKLIERHDSLRTSFHMVKDIPVQKIHNQVPFEIEQLGRSELSSFIRPFDLTRAPLLRIGIVNNKNKSYLLVDMHHIISDGISHSILQEEFLTLYEENELPSRPPLPGLHLQYKDFSEWQNSQKEKESLNQQEAFWLNNLAGELPVLDLPSDYPRPKIKSFAGDIISFEISKQKTNELNALALNEGVTLFMVLTVVFNILLAKLSCQEEIIIGTPVAGRKHADLEKIIGMFVNTLALRNFPLGEKTFKEFLLNVKEQALMAFENQEYPFEELVNHLPLKKDIARNPVFDVMFAWQNIDKVSLPQTGIPDEFANIKKTVKFDLTLTAMESNQGLFLLFQYCTDLFKKETIERFITYFQNITAIVLNDVTIQLANVEIITDEEKKQILFDFNDNQKQYPKDKTIQQLFVEQAAQTPDAIALVARGLTKEEEKINGMHLSYRELNEQSNRLSGLLIEKGIQADSIVAIMMEQSLEMIIGLLGILKSGGAYLPIDPEYPQERIDYMLKDSKAKVLIINKFEARSTKFETNPNDQNPNDQNKNQNFGAASVLNLDHLNFDIVSNFDIRISDFNSSNLAYVIYTSGSTGKPKGVMVEHPSLVNLCCWHNTFYNIASHDRATKYAGFGFDASVWEIFPYLVKGASLYIIPGEIKLDIQALNYYYQKTDITISFLPTQVCEQFLTLDNTSLRILLTGGDKLKNYISKNYRLYNNYGPTENTVVTTSFPVIEEMDNIPIGKPVTNNQIYIFDKDNHLQPVGIPGELCIGGIGLARGYLNNPELTHEKFKSCPQITQINTDFSSPLTNHQSPIYKTGDLARWLPDGNIEFLGRIDQQVKIRGYRIELGEIEYALARHNAVKDVVVTAGNNEKKDNYLCAYIVCRNNFELAGIRQYLGNQLPAYMIPSYFIKLEKIPLTIHGKIDYKALPDPIENSLKNNTEYIPPQNDMEKKLVEIWEKVLSRTNISINENFFQAGGDSIKSIQIISRMNSAGYKLEMKDLFQYPVIADLAPMVKKIQHIPEQMAITGTSPLTPIQEMFFAQDYHDPYHYNQAVMFYARERLAKEEIEAVFKKIQEHHDALRMTYEIKRENGKITKITQIAHDLDYPLSLEEFKINGSTDDLVTIAEKLQASIDLEKGPLMKLALFHLNDGDRLLIVIHHLVIDGVSWRILFADLETLFKQIKQSKKLTLPPKTDAFKTWAENLAVYANCKEFLKEKVYWQKIESLKTPLIIKDSDLADNYIKDTKKISFTLEQEETGLLLTKVNMAFGTEINDILLTALAMSIKKTFDHEQIAIALEGHGREEIMTEIDVSRTVGWFTTLYPVLLDVSYADDLNRQVKEIKEMLRQVPQKGIGYGILKYLSNEENKKEIAFKLKPQISFNYLGQFDSDVKQLSFFEPAKESPGNSQGLNNKREYLLDVIGITANNQLNMTISYNKTHFKHQTMAELNKNFQYELQRLIAFCAAKEKKEFTPSDFTYKGLSIESVNRLMELYPDIEDIYTLTPMQEGMLFHAVADNSSYAYFQQVSYFIKGKLNINVIQKSLNEMTKRHDILCTTFIYKDIERPVQSVLKNKESDFYYEDIRKLKTKKEQENYIKEFKKKDKKRSFDLSKGPLMRVSILRRGELEYEFIWSHHHILMDGWCLGILNTEFFEIYTSYLENRPYHLPGIKPYRMYIQWLEKQDKDESLHYWENYLACYEEHSGVPVSRIKSKEENYYRDETVSFVLDIKKTRRLNELAAGNHVTMNTLVHALWGILLGKYNGKEDVIFGAVVSGRPSELPGVESMTGLFINTIPVRVCFAGKMKFNELLKQIQQEALAGEPYHYHPLAEIQSRTPLKQNLIDHILVFENYPVAQQIEGYKEGKKQSANTLLQPENVSIFEQTNYDFNVIISGSAQLKINLRYNGNIYDKDFVEQVGRHLLFCLDQIIESRELEIRNITLVSEEDKNRIINEFNNTTSDYPKDKTIHQLFAEQAAQTPGAVALVARETREKHEKHITYFQLNQQSNRLAGLLIEKGVLPDSIVGIMMERSVDMIIVILGILKSGGAYLPIDTGYPEERIDYMLKDSNAKILLINKSEIRNPKLESPRRGHPIKNINGLKTNDSNKNQHYRAVSFLNFEDLNLNSIKRRRGLSDFVLRASNLFSSNLAYIIYTSGSTGKPKGVLTTHANVTRVVKNTNYIDIKQGDHLLQLSNYAFDGSVFDIYGALLNGAELVMINKKDILEVKQFSKVIKREGITVFFVTTALFNTLVDMEIGCFDRVRKVLFGGERVSVDHVAKALAYLGKGRIIHVYGPTETTVYATYYFIDSIHEASGNIPIGKPVSNTTVYIFDQYLNPVPIGMPGEIYIGGAGVARGYLNNPELTAEKFIDFPNFLTSSLPNFTLYRTGDLARWLSHGNIEFLGRIDRQVKIRGFRIELDEIENQLIKHKHIKEAVVVLNEDAIKDKNLTAYIISSGELLEGKLREYLQEKLPEYMIPSNFVRLDKIPLTPNGKLDRKALPALEIKRRDEYEPPVNEIEGKLVAIWSEILGIDKNLIGINASFFQLGGHSLKATILASRIHKEFDIILPLGEIFKAPEIKNIAKYIENAKSSVYKNIDWNLVLIKEGFPGDNHLFFIHDGSGEVGGYAEFCKHLTCAFKYWGIRSDRLENMAPCNITTQQLAEKYINSIKKIQPKGPYYIVGWSLGGTIAFEITAQLEQRNEKIAFLGLIDSPPPGEDLWKEAGKFNLESELELIKEYSPAAELLENIKNTKELDRLWVSLADYLEANNYDVKIIKKTIAGYGVQALPNFHQLDLKESIYYLNLERTLRNARATYQPSGKIHTHVHYFAASESKGFKKEYWKEYMTGDIIFYELEGDHFSILKMPIVKEFTKKFAAILRCELEE